MWAYVWVHDADIEHISKATLNRHGSDRMAQNVFQREKKIPVKKRQEREEEKNNNEDLIKRDYQKYVHANRKTRQAPHKIYRKLNLCHMGY